MADRDFPEAAARHLDEILGGLGVGYSVPAPGSFLVRLEGQHKLVTMTWLIVGCRGFTAGVGAA